jgi:uncharacterized protein
VLRFKQLVPAGFCLKCRICCRFPKKPTVWQPHLSKEEARLFRNRDGLKGHIAKGAVKLKAAESFFCCEFFNGKKNSCKIYKLRPLDCRLYPFVLMRAGKQIFLAAHLICPVIAENIRSRKFQRHSDYLKKVLAGKDFQLLIKTNPAFIQSYKGYRQELIPLFPVSCK